MKRYLPVLLLALPFVVALTPVAADTPRTIDVTVSRFQFSPDVIELKRGEKVRLNIVSVDGSHGFEVKELGLQARIASGKTVTLDVMPNEVGSFEIKCSEYCGSGHSQMKARLIVKPAE
jgi:cytochrome c oxidase subunit II